MWLDHFFKLLFCNIYLFIIIIIIMQTDILFTGDK